MNTPHRFTVRASAFVRRNRILLAALLAGLLVSIVATTSRHIVAARMASPAVGLGPTAIAQSGATYDAVSDFSATSNPSGTWSYGWETALGGTFTLNAGERSPYLGLDTWEGPDVGSDFNFPLVSFNHTGATLDYASGVSQPANMLNLHPSYTGKFSVVRWTATTNGSFHIAGLFKGIDTRNTSSDVHVLQSSSTSLLSANINGFGNQSSFDFTRDLNAGDTLDFVVGWGSNNNFNADSTGLAVTITPTNTYNIANGDVAGLIAAIQTANANCDTATTINLAPGGTYTLTSVAENPREYNAPLAVGLPVIRVSITINGNGATFQRSTAPGTPDFVLLAVSGRTESGPPSCYADPVLTLNQTILTGGSQGGLHMNSGNAVVNNSTVTQNTGGGGIIDACGSLTLLNSTVSYNSSDNAFGGGGIFLWGFSCAPGKPTANISFSTIFENQNTSGTNANGDPYGPGYAISNAYGNPSAVIIKNSILASPTRAFFPGSACYAITPVSGGHNIGGDGSCGLTGSGDMQNTNPLLGPLANNGGPTPTHRPLECSPAIDAVPVADSTDTNGASITTDQRGVSRPQGAASDIGAAEGVRTVTLSIPGNAGPWLQSQNPTFDYGVRDNVPPVVIDSTSGNPFVAGSNLTLTYVSGTITGDGGRGYTDANGSTYPTNTYEGGNGRFPGFYMNPGPTVYGGELVGAFAHNGVIVGRPFPIGNGPTNLTIPGGATELMVGINDNYYSDNSGSLIMRVTAGQTGTAPTVSCPSPTTTSADSNCQARVPNVLAGVTASSGCGGPVALSQSPTAGAVVGLGATTITVTATDAANNSSTCTTTFTVTDNTPPTVSCPAPSSASADGNCQARVPNVLAAVVASDCGGPVTLSQTPAAGTLVGLGTTTISVTATDAAHNSSTCTTTFTVTDNTPPTITAPADINVVDNAPGSCGALVNPDTPMTSDNCGTASVVGVRSDGQALTALYPVGATVITWEATDNSGNSACAQQNVVVSNPAPQVSITGPPSGALYVVNTAVNFTGAYTDNTGDSHTAVWTFDGTPQAAVVDEMSHTVSASHTFTTAGVYLVTLDITDDCGQRVATNQVGGFDALVVVYDPNAGFVTGGGWINSPPGAFAANPNLVGSANFGFVAKYQNGANVPDGQTEFQFKVANLNFHSTVYEWLVVAGARAQYKGSGTINGAGNYGFILTAIDGEVSGGGGIDKFRIKIWDKNNGNEVVYDNQMGAGIDDNPTTALARGSIVIHR